ncbi:MAG: hypothetical protein WCP28_01855 [Actinomycetes bacterium]
MTEPQYILFAATYDSLNDARLDLGAIKGLQYDHEIKKVTAAIVSKDEKGRIHVHETTHAGKIAGASGLVAGAILGAVFPPAGIAVAAAAVAGGAGAGIVAGGIGHFTGGVSRKEMKAAGDLLEKGHAALIAVAVDSVSSDVDRALDRAVEKTAHPIDKGDVNAAVVELEQAFKAANDAAAANQNP